MKKIILTFVLVFSHIFVFAQTDQEKGKKEITDGYKFFFIDRGIDPKIDYTLALEDKSNPLNISEQKISPLFAIFLFKQQKNRFEYRNKVFYWNDTPIPLFIELNDFLKKFPDKDFSEDIKKFDPKFNIDRIEISKGVTLKFFKNSGLYYLTEIEKFSVYRDDTNDNDFGIFLIEGFPIKNSFLNKNELKLSIDKLNEISKYKFKPYLRSGTFSTPFEKVEIKDINILQNYYGDNEKFNRMKDKHIENRIELSYLLGKFTLSNQITVIGTDPEEKYYPPPTSGN